MATRLTPPQRLWAAVFGSEGIPRLRPDKVRAVVESLLDQREREAVLLYFGFWGPSLSMRAVGEKLPRVNGGLGVSRSMANKVLRQALGHLKHPSRRTAWEEARRG